MRPQKIADEVILDVIQDYKTTKMSVKKIAEKYGICHTKVYNELNRLNVAKRQPNKPKTMPPIIDDVEQPKEPINMACERGYFNTNACVNWVV